MKFKVGDIIIMTNASTYHSIKLVLPFKSIKSYDVYNLYYQDDSKLDVIYVNNNYELLTSILREDE